MTQPISTEAIVERVLLKRLLVAHDFSSLAEAALAYSLPLAKLLGSEITLVHVVAAAELDEGDLSMMKRAQYEACEQLESIARRIRSHGLPCRTVCRIGMTSDVLVQLVSELNPDLLILGAYGHTKPHPGRLGSTAEFIMRAIRCPTLTIGPHAATRGKHAWHIERLLFTTSLPVHPGRALRLAQAIAKANSARVEVVHVVDRIKRASLDTVALESQIDSVAKQFIEVGLETTCRLLEQPAGKALEDAARRSRANLVVFGIEHEALDPRVATMITEIVQTAECPVLTIPGGG